MTIKSIIDEKGQPLVVDYTIMSDGTYLCAIRGFIEPMPISKIGTPMRSDLGTGIARTRYYALDRATDDFYKKYTSDEENKIVKNEDALQNIR